MGWLLLVLALGWLGLCALLWATQDALVFPGAGRGDRGLPLTSPQATPGWITTEGRRTRLATVAWPAPRAVLLYFGGNGEDLYAATGNAAALAAHGCEAIAVEYPGFGASEGKPSVATLLATARTAAAHARARATALGVPLFVVGSSLGSFCAVEVAAAVGVDRLLLRAPPTTLAAVAATSFRWLPVGLLLAHRFDNLAQAARVRCPVLVVHGDADGIVPDRFGKELAAALPDATFVPVPGGGHNDIDLSPAGPVGGALRTFFAGR
jgi:pimeloyl-ACP methyl ester carboxylesterase